MPDIGGLDGRQVNVYKLPYMQHIKAVLTLDANCPGTGCQLFLSIIVESQYLSKHYKL